MTASTTQSSTVGSTNRDYLDPLLDETLGRVALLFTAALMGLGIYWLRRIVRIEI